MIALPLTHPCRACREPIRPGTLLCTTCWELLPDDVRIALAWARKAEFNAAARLMERGEGRQGDALASAYDEAILRTRTALENAFCELERLRRRAAAS